MRRTSTVLVALVLGLVATLAGCSDSTDKKPSADPAAAATSEPESVALSLLVFNVEYGGSKATDAVMADLDADVVGVLESYNRLPEIARQRDTRTTTSACRSCRSTRSSSRPGRTVSTPTSRSDPARPSR